MKLCNIHLLIPASIVLLGMAACSSHDDHSEPVNTTGRQIRFAASTELAKAGDITTNNLTEFNVYAFRQPVASMGSTPYMNDVKVTKTGNNTWTYTPTAYWPSEGTVSFYAYAPAGWVGTGGPLKAVPYDVVTPDALPATTDLVYAVSPDLSGNADTPNAQVVFNFRHALSKVTVRMSSTSPDLQVNVTNVVLVGLKTRGNFHFPEGNTAEAPDADNTGSWSGQNSPMSVILHMSQTPADIITLTTTPTDMGDTGLGFGGSKYLIPQLLSWRSNGTGADTYIAVMCSVYDSKTGTKLWPNANTPEHNVVAGSTFGDGLLKFPLSTSAFSTWQPGYHYIYNLVINANEEMGSIEFGNPTVDTFVDVTTTYE